MYKFGVFSILAVCFTASAAVIPNGTSQAVTSMPATIAQSATGATTPATAQPSVDFGSCQYLDYYVFNCLKFTCIIPAKVGTYSINTTFNVSGTVQDKCNLYYKFDTRHDNGQSYPIKINCSLDKDGIYAFRTMWYEYISGKGPGFTQSPTDANLTSSCNPSLDYGN